VELRNLNLFLFFFVIFIEILSNKRPLPMSVSGSCAVTTLTGSAVVCGYATAGTNTINGQNLSND